MRWNNNSSHKMVPVIILGKAQHDIHTTSSKWDRYYELKLTRFLVMDIFREIFHKSLKVSNYSYNTEK